jgi:3-hydroxymyristoyl/3-hydroxydecanoyl-(acyl carrier protein) dehydratase
MDITPQLDCFRGHFPGNPVLPGVVQLHWAVVVSMAYFDFDYVPVEIKRLKFKNVVIPPRVVELTISRSGQHEVRFNYSGLGLRHSEGRLIFDEDSTC